jgi:hypothetical protein
MVTRAVAGQRRASEQIERPNLGHHSLPHPGRADNRAFVPFHPGMLGWFPVRHEFTDFFSHVILPQVKRNIH